MTFEIRAFHPDDAPALSELINHTIRLGGSTAYETAFDLAGFLDEFHSGAEVHSTRVAWSGATRAGFQSLCHLEPEEAPNLGIGTFTDRRVRFPGAGQALFRATRNAAEAHGARYIQATIRADNEIGLRYYRGLGFKDFAVFPSVPLQDGTPIDRIETRYFL